MSKKGGQKPGYSVVNQFQEDPEGVELFDNDEDFNDGTKGLL